MTAMVPVDDVKKALTSGKPNKALLQQLKHQAGAGKGLPSLPLIKVQHKSEEVPLKEFLAILNDKEAGLGTKLIVTLLRARKFIEAYLNDEEDNFIGRYYTSEFIDYNEKVNVYFSGNLELENVTREEAKAFMAEKLGLDDEQDIKDNVKTKIKIHMIVHNKSLTPLIGEEAESRVCVMTVGGSNFIPFSDFVQNEELPMYGFKTEITKKTETMQKGKKTVEFQVAVYTKTEEYEHDKILKNYELSCQLDTFTEVVQEYVDKELTKPKASPTGKTNFKKKTKAEPIEVEEAEVIEAEDEDEEIDEEDEAVDSEEDEAEDTEEAAAEDDEEEEEEASEEEEEAEDEEEDDETAAEETDEEEDELFGFEEEEEEETDPKKKPSKKKKGK